MVVTVTVSELYSGKVQIAAFYSSHRPGFVLSCKNREQAGGVLVGLGLDRGIVERTLELLVAVGPLKRLEFPEREIDANVLRSHGFHLD